jgi:transposase
MTYSDHVRRILFQMVDAGDSWVSIGRALSRSADAVREYYKRHAVNRHLPPKIKVAKRVTDGRVGLYLKGLVKENPKISIRDLEYKMKVHFSPAGIPTVPLPSKSTIHIFLQRNQIQVVKLLRKPLIRNYNIEKRINFARNALATPDLLTELARTTIWSDETTVRSHPTGKEMIFRCHSSIKREDLPVNAQVQAGGISVMFWGCFSSNGLGPLVALEGSQNQYTYLELLKDYLLPEVKAAKNLYNVDMTFMQDNAPCHKTRMIMDFLARKQIKTLDWPAQSPDMNPIENLWAIIKRKRAKKFGIPTSKAMLINQIMDIWDNLEADLIETLAASIKNRLKEVVRLKGKATKY